MTTKPSLSASSDDPTCLVGVFPQSVTSTKRPDPLQAIVTPLDRRRQPRAIYEAAVAAELARLRLACAEAWDPNSVEAR